MTTCGNSAGSRVRSVERPPRPLWRATELRGRGQTRRCLVDNLYHPKACPVVPLTVREGAWPTRASPSVRTSRRTRVVGAESRRRAAVLCEHIGGWHANQRRPLTSIAAEVSLAVAARSLVGARPEKNEAVQMLDEVIEAPAAEQGHVPAVEWHLIADMDFLIAHPDSATSPRCAPLAYEVSTPAGYQQRGSTIQPSHAAYTAYVRCGRQVI